jgi:hypothetical protein
MPMRFMCLLLILSTALSLTSAPRQVETQSSDIVLVKAGRPLDVRKGAYIENAAILIEGERIQEVGPAAQVQADAPRAEPMPKYNLAVLMPLLSSRAAAALRKKYDPFLPRGQSCFDFVP